MAAKVKLLAGPVRSGKTAKLLAEYRNALSSPPTENLWIGPDRQSVAQVRDSLLASSAEGYLGLKILTFANYAESIVATSSKRIRPITHLQKRRVLQAAIAQATEAGQVVHYATVAKTPGFQAQAGELIAELKRRDVWPADFYPRCIEQREQEMAAIFERYQQYLLEYDLYDSEGRFWAAREILPELITESNGSEYSTIVVDGFTDFTSAQYDILRLLTERSANVLISLTLEQNSAEALDRSTGRALLFARTSETLSRLRHIFPNLHVCFEGESRFASPGLGHLAKNLFCEPQEIAETGNDPTGIEIVAASSVQQELVEIAQRMKELLRNGKTRPDEIALVFRSLEEAGSRVRETLADHGIPFALEAQTRLMATPLVRTLLTLLRLHAENWPFRQLLDVLSNRMLRALDAASTNAEHGTNDLRAVMERSVRSVQLPAGRQALFDQLERVIAAQGEKPTKQAIEAGATLSRLKQLAELLDRLPREASLRTWIDRVLALQVGLGILPDELERDAACFRRVNATWQILQRGLGAVESVDGQITADVQPLSIVDFLELLETVARDQRLPADYDPTGRVRVLSSDTGRHISAKHLFLAGLGEQSFASVARSNPLFEVRRFDQTSGAQETAGAGSEPLNNEAMQLFYELATRATEQLTLSYAAKDAKGQTLPASPLLGELKRCFGSVTIDEKKPLLGDDVQTNRQPQSETAFRQQAVARAFEGNRNWLAGLMSDPSRARVAAALGDGIRCIAERGKREGFGIHDGLVSSEAARKVLAQQFDSKHLWSASQLEEYATCPFRFFGEQLLALEPPAELALRSDVRRRGSLLHQVLAALHQQVEDVPTEKNAAGELVERFYQALKKAVEAAPLFGLQQALREIERREIEALAPQYAEQEVDYQGRWGHLDEPPYPAFFEVRFGPKSQTHDETEDSGSTTLPFELNLGHEKILLTGQIDRVDVGRVGGVTVFNIIDYKSGKEVRLQDEKLRAGQQLQLPLYAMAAEHLLLADQNAMALTTGYWSVAGRGFSSGRSGALEVRQLQKGDLQTTDQWDQLQPVLLEKVQELVQGIRRGQFPVYNSDENCTRWCSLATICRVGHIRSLEKVWVPPEEPTQE